MSDDDIAQRTKERMARLGIPKGTDDPLLLALGATPLSEIGLLLAKGDCACGGTIVQIWPDGSEYRCMECESSYTKKYLERLGLR